MKKIEGIGNIKINIDIDNCNKKNTKKNSKNNESQFDKIFKNEVNKIDDINEKKQEVFEEKDLVKYYNYKSVKRR